MKTRPEVWGHLNSILERVLDTLDDEAPHDAAITALGAAMIYMKRVHPDDRERILDILKKTLVDGHAAGPKKAVTPRRAR
jgi:hypothetical protein